MTVTVLIQVPSNVLGPEACLVWPQLGWLETASAASSASSGNAAFLGRMAECVRQLLDRTGSPLAIRLFGSFEVCRAGQPLPPLRSRKGQWLLALLVLRAGQEVERAWLAGTLWPDSSEAQALANLRNSLTDLRGALGPEEGRLQSPTPRTLCLDLTGAAVDVVAFDAALAQAAAPALEQAVALYRGPLLEGCMEEWAFQERQVREQAYLCALETLAAQAQARGDRGAAERHLRRAVAVDPLCDTAQRALMQALAASGNYAAALATYRDLRHHLHRELNAEPDPETRALFQQIRAEARAKAGTVGAPRAAGVSDTAVTPGPAPQNLPLQLTRFIGREDLMAEIAQLLPEHRLVTLTGAGGCGKTRLALQVAADLVGTFPDGVWFVDFAPLAAPELVPQTAATALGLQEAPGCPPAQRLRDYLEARQLLLVLDNCEHLIGACAPLAHALLQSCPRLRVLATSREALGIAGERSYRVPPLSLPDPQRRPTLEQLTQYEAVRLFMERAAAVLPSFQVTDENARVVTEVCQRLDGIPLAIELAAARMKALSVEKLNERLDDMFRLLTRGSRTALPRQQTLRALIDWSYDLLSPSEQALLRRLSVFAGGWTLEAAEAVGVGEGVEEWEVLEWLTSLVEKSLVLYEERGSEGRYRLLETVRQYARDRLLEAGEAAAVRARHLKFFLNWAEQEPGMDRLEREHDNLRAALGWSRSQGEGEAGLRLCAALWWFWHLQGYWTEGREHLAGLLALPGAQARTAARAWALIFAGILARSQGEYGAARALFEESLAIFRELGDKGGIAESLIGLGFMAREQGEYEAAWVLYEESLAINRELGGKYGIVWSLNNLGNVAHNEGDYGEARALLEESLTISRELGAKKFSAMSLNRLGFMAREQGDLGAARALIEESLAIFRALGHKQGIAPNLEGLASLAVAQGQSERAARLFGAAAALREAIAAPLPPADRAKQDRSVAAVRTALGEAAFAAAWAEGRAMRLEEAIRYALEEIANTPLTDGLPGHHTRAPDIMGTGEGGPCQ